MQRRGIGLVPTARWAALFAVAVCAPVRSEPVTRLDVVGGFGGTYFEHMCGPGRVLVGVRSYAGQWLDNVQAVCARTKASGLSDAQPQGPIFGGGGGRTTRGYECPSGTVVAGFGVLEKSNEHFLAAIAFRCSDAFTLRPVSADFTGKLQGAGPVKSIGSPLLMCPQQTVAIGIRGRSGVYLDAFGLVCGPMPEELPVRRLGKRPSSSNVLTPQPSSGPSPFGSTAPPDRSAAVVSQSGGPAGALGGCKPGFVSRAARPDDSVCVPPEARARSVEENRVAAQRRDPAGAYGPNTCKPGFVWREAFAGDVVCVTPEVRTQVREENRLGPGRRAGK